ncbi:T9SS type A sorting domain-containing protein [Aestuariivivens sediminis]|uniref:T9SS type A sorting domain-containing protein n=1 Tax=Aestuariivivens sediminis TaxID=2913557 RepID=UPI001F56B82B|nr:T9SS type A sorting domain-containing protein [Aestuariivivens sediminis]
MKIFTSGFLVLVLVWTPFANAQYETIRIDQEDYYQKDPASPNNASVLVYVSRNEFHYDNGGNKYTRVESFSRPTGTSDWMPSFQIINAYDVNNNLETSETQVFDGSQYQSSVLREYFYDMDGNIDVINTSQYLNMIWTPYSRNDYSFNPDNTISEVRTDIWNTMTNDYDYWSLFTYSYTNGLLTGFNAFTYNGMTPVDNYRASYTLNGFDEIDYILFEKYTGSVWENWRQIQYNYFAEYLLDTEEEFWDKSLTPAAWINSGKTLYSYTTIDGQTVFNQILGQAWDRDESNGGANPFWFDSYKLVYQLSSILSTPEDTVEKGLAYPNPFKNVVTISLPQPLKEDAELYLLDPLGKEVSKAQLKAGTASLSLSNSHLAQGIYFIKITNRSFHQTIKIIKE